MNMTSRAKTVAVFAENKAGLLYGYYLQRFGFNVHIFIDDTDDFEQLPNRLVSTWLCFEQNAHSATIAREGISELREIAIDLGAGKIGMERESVIFERRAEYLSSFEHFVTECRSKGLLARFSNNPHQHGLPIGTLASARFIQDVAVNPTILCSRLAEVIKERGGQIERVAGDLIIRKQCEDPEWKDCVSHEAYDLVIRLENSATACEPSSLNSIFGRNLSFEKSLELISKRSRAEASDSVRQASDREKRATAGLEAPGIKPSGFVKRLGEKGHVYSMKVHQDLAHWVAHARRFAELAHGLDQAGRSADGALGQAGSAPSLSWAWIG